MFNRIRSYALFGGLCLVLASPSRAVLGIGAHWGADLTLNMPDMEGRYASVEKYLPNVYDAGSVVDVVRSTTGEELTAEQEQILDSVITLIENNQVPALTKQLPMTFNRIDLERTPINFGAKVYVDIIPLLDAVELSFNLGAWEYYGFLLYPRAVDQSIQSVDDIDLSDPSNLSYDDFLTLDTMDLTLEAFEKDFLWFDQTPLLKLQFDLTVRKNILTVPGRMKILKVYAGGGPSVHFTTPVLTEEFVMDVIEETIKETGMDFATLMDPSKFMDKENGLGEKIMRKLLDESMVPKWGMHLVLGTHVKPPILPIGFYGDAKLMIPFGPYNEDAQLEGYGFLFNVGLTVGL
ncbi:MAG: hypothetical protein GF344_02185 [Chitinivibrionales bacterium]|nr:hypothetical protein [Chitinivibrionales bacterium]MBD3355903.1 hypothetical protein [Chitinivibrionales bacterium]